MSVTEEDGVGVEYTVGAMKIKASLTVGDALNIGGSTLAVGDVLGKNEPIT